MNLPGKAPNVSPTVPHWLNQSFWIAAAIAFGVVTMVTMDSEAIAAGGGSLFIVARLAMQWYRDNRAVDGSFLDRVF